MQPHHIVNDPEFWSRMENWRHVVRNRSVWRTCGSMEKRYRSPQIWEPQNARVPVDMHDAEFMETLWRSIAMDCRLLVRSWWIHASSPEATCRKLKIKPYRLDMELRRSVMLMYDRIHKPLDDIMLIAYKDSKSEFTV